MRQACIAALCVALGTAGMTVRAEESGSAPLQQEESEVDTNLPIGPILLGSFGAVAALVGAGFAWQAKGEYDNYNERDASATYDTQKVYPQATQSLADDIKTHVIVADVLMFAGAAAMGASLIWGLVRHRKDGTIKVEAQASAIRPAVAPNQLGLVVDF